jgi:hypothetical protein
MQKINLEYSGSNHFNNAKLRNNRWGSWLIKGDSKWRIAPSLQYFNHPHFETGWVKELEEWVASPGICCIHKQYCPTKMHDRNLIQIPHLGIMLHLYCHDLTLFPSSSSDVLWFIVGPADRISLKYSRQASVYPVMVNWGFAFDVCLLITSESLLAPVTIRMLPVTPPGTSYHRADDQTCRETWRYAMLAMWSWRYMIHDDEQYRVMEETAGAADTESTVRGLGATHKFHYYYVRLKPQIIMCGWQW